MVIINALLVKNILNWPAPNTNRKWKTILMNLKIRAPQAKGHFYIFKQDKQNGVQLV